jgi:hypothetical protein
VQAISQEPTIGKIIRELQSVENRVVREGVINLTRIIIVFVPKQCRKNPKISICSQEYWLYHTIRAYMLLTYQLLTGTFTLL